MPHWKPTLEIVGVVLGIVATVIGLVSALKNHIHDAEYVAPGTLRELQSATIIVVPFRGANQASKDEGELIAALIGSELRRRMKDRLDHPPKVLEITSEEVQDHEQAFALGKEYEATLVLWGEAFSISGQTEIQPHLTPIRTPAQEAARSTITNASGIQASEFLKHLAADLASRELLGRSSFHPGIGDQIELRRVSASKVSDLALTILALTEIVVNPTDRQRAKRALCYLEKVGNSEEKFKYMGMVLRAIGEREKAIRVLEEGLQAHPRSPDLHASAGDLYSQIGNYGKSYKYLKEARELKSSYTTTGTFLKDGTLYTPETARLWDIFRTSRLLAVDPASGRILSRKYLVGVPLAATRKNSKLVLALKQPWSGRIIREEMESFGKTTPLRFYTNSPSERYLYRVIGGELLSNFSQALSTYGIERGLKFGDLNQLNMDNEVTLNDPLVRSAEQHLIDDRLPTTLTDLEEALTREVRRDPKQPWHRFNLGLTLLALGRADEGEKQWEALFTPKYEETPYFEFSAMARQFERLNQYNWTHRAFVRALEKRRELRQPVSYSLAYEADVNGIWELGALRTTGQSKSWKREYTLVQWSRKLTGAVVDVGPICSATWADFLGYQGRQKLAAEERDYLSEISSNPFDFASRGARRGYLFLSALSLQLTLLILSVAIVARVLISIPVRRWMPFLSRVISFGQPVAATVPRRLCIVVAAAGVLSVFFMLPIVLVGYGEATAGVVVFFMSLLSVGIIASGLLVTLKGVPQKVMSGLAVTAIMAVICSLLAWKALSTDFMQIYGIGDSLAHPEVLEYLEGQVSDRVSDSRTLFVAALANHLAGRNGRARTLYGRIQSDERALENLDALDANPVGKLPQLMGIEDLHRAFVLVRGSTVDRLRTLTRMLGESWAAIYLVGGLGSGLFGVILVGGIIWRRLFKGFQEAETWEVEKGGKLGLVGALVPGTGYFGEKVIGFGMFGVVTLAIVIVGLSPWGPVAPAPWPGLAVEWGLFEARACSAYDVPLDPTWSRLVGSRFFWVLPGAGELWLLTGFSVVVVGIGHVRWLVRKLRDGI